MIQTTQIQPDKGTDPYWEKFDQLVKETKTPGWLLPIRKAALSRFSEMGFPTLRDEDWRFTNVAPIAKLPFRPTLQYSSDGLNSGELKRFAFAGMAGSRLVFVNGHFSKELSSLVPQAAGIEVGSLAAMLARDPTRVQNHLARHARVETNAFAALNTGFFQDGAFIHVPPDQKAEGPVQLLYISTGKEKGATSHPRNLVIAERGSQLTLLESYVSTTESASFTNAVTELVIGDAANVEHCKFQDESLSAFHIATLHAHLGRSCNFVSHSIATGARISRNNIYTALAGEGIECVLNGLYLTRGDQLADHHMIVDHAQPRCASHEYFNGILAEKSKGVFHGRILVRPGAQKTDAKQTNKNLLLSDDATVDTKPQLEIYADDVKCTHGATVGQLNEESIFYLRARGIGAETARRMLIHAFAGEIIDRIKNDDAREELDRLVWDRLEQNEKVAVNK